MRQHLFSGARTFDSSRADLHPMAFFFLEDLLLTAWCHEVYSTLIISHLHIGPTGADLRLLMRTTQQFWQGWTGASRVRSGVNTEAAGIPSALGT